MRSVRSTIGVPYNDGMKIFLVCPAPPGSLKGNRVTANRWASHLQDLGHDVVISSDWQGEACEVMIALHARKSFPAVRKYRKANPSGPLVVALTGTDLYHDLPHSRRAQQSIRWADRLIGLHDAVADDLPKSARTKVRVILQSLEPMTPQPARSDKHFTACVLGHLRYEKDPLRAALALRRLPWLAQVRLTQAGQALTSRYDKLARIAMRRDARYRWLGEISRPRALRLLASNRLMIISSRMEGGANVVSEAIVNGVPVLASRIAGNVGLLGADYPAYYAVADERALADLLERACTDAPFYRELNRRIAQLAPRFQPARERASLAALMNELR